MAILGGSRLAAQSAMLAATLCGAAAGCGGSARPTSVAATARPPRAQAAERVCSQVRSAAAALVSEVEVRIVDADPANLECLLSGRSVRVDVVAQAVAQAWTEYDTMVVHQVQAYGPGSVHAPLQLPKTVRGLGGNAAWIPARRELVATNSTPTVGGSYITVNVTRTSARRPGSLALATSDRSGDARIRPTRAEPRATTGLMRASWVGTGSHIHNLWPPIATSCSPPQSRW